MNTNTEKQREVRKLLLESLQRNTGLFLKLANSLRKYFGEQAVLKIVATGEKEKTKFDARFTNARLLAKDIRKAVKKREMEDDQATAEILRELEDQGGSMPFIPSIPVVIFSPSGFSFMRIQCQAGDN